MALSFLESILNPEQKLSYIFLCCSTKYNIEVHFSKYRGLDAAMLLPGTGWEGRWCRSICQLLYPTTQNIQEVLMGEGEGEEV